MKRPIVEAWLVNCASTLALLDVLTPEQWELPAEKGKPIRAQFAHLHNVRLMWIKMSDKSLLGSMEQADRRKGAREQIRAALVESSKAIARMLEAAGCPDGNIKGHGRTAITLLTSAAAHDGFHRGQIELILRQNGMEIDEVVMVKLWDYPHLARIARAEFSEFFS